MVLLDGGQIPRSLPASVPAHHRQDAVERGHAVVVARHGELRAPPPRRGLGADDVEPGEPALGVAVADVELLLLVFRTLLHS